MKRMSISSSTDKTRDRRARSEIHILINYICNKEELPHSWKESVGVPIHKKDDEHTVVITEAYHCNQVHMKFYRLFLCRLLLIVEESTGYHYCGFGLNS
jgi:hypothetical protein